MAVPRGRLVVRADAHPAIGSGHVMRCLALAHAWQERGGVVTFVGRIDAPTRGRLQAEGCPTVGVADVHPHPVDVATTREVASGADVAAVAVDGYAFDPPFLRALAGMSVRTLVLDDMASLSTYPCDVLLNANFATAEDYAGRTSARLLVGPRYAMLRRDLRIAAEKRDQRSPGSGRPQQLLLTFGGSDPADVSRRAIEAVSLLPPGAVRARCLVGPSHPHAEEVVALGAARGVDVLVAVRDMSAQLAWADLALAASGSTSWELAAFGVPTLSVVVAENQRRIAVGMADRGAARYLGDAVELTATHLATAIGAAIADVDALTAMSAAARRVVDGRGAARVAAALAGDVVSTGDA